jgi:hypothetical protein
MPCASSTTSDAVFGHNPHAPYGLRQRGGISGVVAPPRYARYRVVAPPWICRAPTAGGSGARNATHQGFSATSWSCQDDPGELREH